MTALLEPLYTSYSTLQFTSLMVVVGKLQPTSSSTLILPHAINKKQCAL